MAKLYNKNKTSKVQLQLDELVKTLKEKSVITAEEETKIKEKKQ